ncbi:hypothetical protein, partial [Thalassolituus sp.]|uniref:hypothetical protein n=1 Tax=Thalassolituus sp. TaxID=2030822 RepID=UPI003510FD24
MSETTLEDLENALGGAKVNRLLDQVTLIQKYLWEQTFALCLYSRSCYVGNDQTKAQDFAMRIRMANLLTHFEGSHDTLRTNLRGTALRVDLMEMLSGGQSCPTIAGAYRHDRLTHSDESAWELEEKLAEKAITFTKSEDKHPYTFEQMHISMCNPLALFQQLLLLSP